VSAETGATKSTTAAGLVGGSTMPARSQRDGPALWARHELPAYLPGISGQHRRHLPAFAESGGLTGENVGMRVTYVLVIQLPAEGVASFQRYESAVLPLLAENRGTLE
jgi:hypothetical protein